MAVEINYYPKHNWRLRFHLQTPTGSITDPNGLSQMDGVYHIFHQYRSTWPYIGKSWGHWTSTNLVDWTFLGAAISPDGDLDRDGSYSGSAIVKDGALWCYYTGNVLLEGDYDYDYAGRLANECLVISEDGEHFGEKRLVLGNEGYPAYCSNHVRDPKVWQQDGNYYMLLGARTRDDRGCALLYRSMDAVAWEFVGSATNRDAQAFGYMWECPNVAQLVAADGSTREFLFICPQGIPKQPFAYQNLHNNGYFAVEGKLCELMACDTGDIDAPQPYACFDAANFVELDYGFDFYAQQLFEDERGRTLLIGWVGIPDIEFEYDTPTREWMHTLTVPRELSLNAAGRVCTWPVEEIDGLRADEVAFSAQAAHGATGFVGSSHYDEFDLTGAVSACFKNGTADVLIDDIEGEGRVIIGSDLELLLAGDVLELDFQSPAGRWRTNRRLRVSDLSAGKLESLRIMVDTSVVEIYVNGGEKTFTTRWYPLEVSNLHVTSSFTANYQAWEMGEFSFTNVG